MDTSYKAKDKQPIVLNLKEYQQKRRTRTQIETYNDPPEKGKQTRSLEKIGILGVSVEERVEEGEEE